jgi:hypothetical protein
MSRNQRSNGDLPISKSLSINHQGIKQSRNQQLFHRGSIGGPTLANILESNSIINSSGAKHNARRSILGDEKLMQVASVYAIGSLSPVL